MFLTVALPGRLVVYTRHHAHAYVVVQDALKQIKDLRARVAELESSLGVPCVPLPHCPFNTTYHQSSTNLTTTTANQPFLGPGRRHHIQGSYRFPPRRSAGFKAKATSLLPICPEPSTIHSQPPITHVRASIQRWMHRKSRIPTQDAELQTQMGAAQKRHSEEVHSPMKRCPHSSSNTSHAYKYVYSSYCPPQAETEAVDAQRQLASVRDASRMVEQKLQETHTKAVEDLQQQLTAAKVWWHCLFYSRGVVVSGFCLSANQGES